MGDALFGSHQRGHEQSAITFFPKSILIAADPVAMDMYALSLINEKRSTISGQHQITTEPDQADANRADARHIITASKKPYSLGATNFEIVPVAV